MSATLKLAVGSLIVGALVLNAILMFVVGSTLGGWLGQLVVGFIGACLLIAAISAIRKKT